MADMKIDDATLDTEVTGTELLPASDGGVAKAVSTGKIGDYVMGRIAAAAAAAGISLDNDKVYLLQGGTIKPFTASALAGAILDYAFGLVAVVSPNGNEILSVKDSGTKKTITLTALKEKITGAAEGFNLETRFVPFVRNAQIEGSWVMTG